jgi:hypothetical protein
LLLRLNDDIHKNSSQSQWNLYAIFRDTQIKCFLIYNLSIDGTCNPTFLGGLTLTWTYEGTGTLAGKLGKCLRSSRKGCAQHLLHWYQVGSRLHVSTHVFTLLEVLPLACAVYGWGTQKPHCSPPYPPSNSSGVHLESLLQHLSAPSPSSTLWFWKSRCCCLTLGQEKSTTHKILS